MFTRESNKTEFYIIIVVTILLIFSLSCHEEEVIKNWDDMGPIWSPEGRYIAFNRVNRSLNPYAWSDTSWQDSLTGLRILELSSLKVIDSLISTFCVDWSPNGDEILCSDGKVYNVKDHSMKVILDTSEHGYPQDWSCDGTRILCTKENNSPDSSMILMIDTLGNYSKILFNSGVTPCWHPHGGQLVFITTLNSKKTICIGDTNGNITKIINVEAGDLIPFHGRGPRFSPDGTKILYFVYQLKDGDFDDFNIYMCDTSGQNHTKLIDGIHPFWSPSGSKIAFARYSPQDSEFFSSIWIMDVNGTNLKKITE
jgi:Tol biopolymer transport system component